MSSHAFHQLYYHFVWTTKGRESLLIEELCPSLLLLLEAQARTRGGIVLACNVMPDHVHLAVTMPPTLALSDYIGQVKGGCAFEFNKQHRSLAVLAWQQGYGVISFRKAEQDKVVRYVQNQRVLHARRKTSRLMETTMMDESDPEGPD